MANPNNGFFNQRFNLPIDGSQTTQDYVTQQIPKATPLPQPSNLPNAAQVNPTQGAAPSQPTPVEDIFVPNVPQQTVTPTSGGRDRRVKIENLTPGTSVGMNALGEPIIPAQQDITMNGLESVGQVAKNYPVGAIKAVNDINSLPQTLAAGAYASGSNQMQPLIQEAKNNAMLAEARGDTAKAEYYNNLVRMYEQSASEGLKTAQEYADKATGTEGLFEGSKSGRLEDEANLTKANYAINFLSKSGMKYYEGEDIDYWQMVKSTAEESLRAMDTQGAPESVGQQMMQWASDVQAANQNLSSVGQFFAGLAESAGRMTVTQAVGKAAAGLGVLTGQVGLIAHAEDIGLAAMGFGVYNTEFKQSIQDGYDVTTATRKSVIAAGTEVASELLVSGLPGFKVKDPVTGTVYEKEGLIDKIISKVAEKALNTAEAKGVTSGGIKALGEVGANYLKFVNSPAGKVITDINGEGWEEVFADVVNPLMNRMFNPGAAEEDKKVQYGHGELITSWLGGAISSAFFQSTGALGEYVKRGEVEQMVNKPTPSSLDADVESFLRDYRNTFGTTPYQSTETGAAPRVTREQLEAVVAQHKENLERMEKAEVEDIPFATDEQKEVFEKVKLVNYAMLAGLNTMTEESKGEARDMGVLSTKLRVDFLPDSLLTWTPNMTMQMVDDYIANVVIPAYNAQNAAILGEAVTNTPFVVADIPTDQVFDGTIKFKPADVALSKVEGLKAGGKKLTVAQLNATGVNDTKLTPEQRLAIIKEYIDPERLFKRLYAESPSGAEQVYSKDLVTAYENTLNLSAFKQYGVLRVGDKYINFRDFVKEHMRKDFESLSKKDKAQAVTLFQEAQLESTPKEYITKIEEQLGRFGITTEWLTSDYLKDHPNKYGDVSKDGVLRLNPYRINSRGGASYIIAHEILGHFAQNNNPDLNMTDVAKEICESIGIDYEKEREATAEIYPDLPPDKLEGEVNASVMGRLLASDTLLDYFSAVNIDDARELQSFLDTLIAPDATDAFTRQIRGIYANIAQSIDGTFAQRKEENEVLRAKTTEEELAEEEEELAEDETEDETEEEPITFDDVVAELEEKGLIDEPTEEIPEEPDEVQIPAAPKTYVATDPVVINLPSTNPLAALNGWRMIINETYQTLKLSQPKVGEITDAEQAALNLLGAKTTHRGKYRGVTKYWNKFRGAAEVVEERAADGTLLNNPYNPYQYRVKGESLYRLGWLKLGGAEFGSDKYVKLLRTHTVTPVTKGMENKRQRQRRITRDNSVESMLAENMTYNITKDITDKIDPADKKGKKKLYPSMKPLEGAIIKVNTSTDRNGTTFRNYSIEPPGDAFTGDALKMIKGAGFHAERREGVNRRDDLSGNYVGREKTIYYMSESNNPGFLSALRAGNWEEIFGKAKDYFKEKKVTFPNITPGMAFSFVNPEQRTAGENQRLKKEVGVMFWPSKAALRGELGRYNPDGMNADDEAWGHMVGVIILEKDADGTPTKVATPNAGPYRLALQAKGFGGTQELGGNVLARKMNFAEFRDITGANADVINDLIDKFKRANPKLVVEAATSPETVFVRRKFGMSGLDLATRDPRTGIITYDTGDELEFNTLYLDNGRWVPYVYKGGKSDTTRTFRSADVPISTTLKVTYKDGHTETVKNESLSGDEFTSETLDEKSTFDTLAARNDVLRIESEELLELASQFGVPSAAVLYDAYDPQRSAYNLEATMDWVFKGNMKMTVTRTNDPIPETIELNLEGFKRGKTNQKNKNGKKRKDVYGSVLQQFAKLVKDPSVVSIIGADNDMVLYLNTSPAMRKRTLQGIQAALDPYALSWHAHGKDLRIKFKGDPVWYPFGSKTAFDYGITDKDGNVYKFDPTVEKIILKGNRDEIQDNVLRIIKDGKVVGRQTFEEWLETQSLPTGLKTAPNAKEKGAKLSDKSKADRLGKAELKKLRAKYNDLVREQRNNDVLLYDGRVGYNAVIESTYPEFSNLYVELDSPEYKKEDGSPMRLPWSMGIFDDYINTKGIMQESSFRDRVVDRLNVAISALNTMRTNPEVGEKYTPDPKKYEAQTAAKWEADIRAYTGAISSMGGGFVSLDNKIVSLTRKDGSYVYKRSMYDPENPNQSFGSAWFDTDVASAMTRYAGGEPEMSEYIPLEHIPYDPNLTEEAAKERAYKYQIGYTDVSSNEELEDIAGEADTEESLGIETKEDIDLGVFGKFLPKRQTDSIDNTRDDEQTVDVLDETFTSKSGKGTMADIAAKYAKNAEDAERIRDIAAARSAQAERDVDLIEDIAAENEKRTEAEDALRQKRAEERQREKAGILGFEHHVTQQMPVECQQAPELNALKSWYSYRDDEIQLGTPAYGDKFMPFTVEAQNLLGYYQFYMKEVVLNKDTKYTILAAKYNPAIINALGMKAIDVKNDNSQSIHSLADDMELYNLASNGSITIYDTAGKKGRSEIKVDSFPTREKAVKKISQLREKGRLYFEDNGSDIQTYSLYENNAEGIRRFRAARPEYKDKRKYSDKAISIIMEELAQIYRKQTTYAENTQDTLAFKKDLDEALAAERARRGEGEEIPPAELIELIRSVARPYELARQERQAEKDRQYLARQLEETRLRFFSREGLDLEDADVLNEAAALFPKNEEIKAAKEKSIAALSDAISEVGKPYIKKAEKAAKQAKHDAAYRDALSDLVRDFTALDDTSEAGIASFREKYGTLTEKMTDTQVKAEMGRLKETLAKRAQAVAEKLKAEEKAAERLAKAQEKNAKRDAKLEKARQKEEAARMKRDPEYRAEVLAREALSTELPAQEERYAKAFADLKVNRSAMNKSDLQKIDALLKGRDNAFYRSRKDGSSLEDSDSARLEFLKSHDVPSNVAGFVELANEWLDEIGYNELGSVVSGRANELRGILGKKYDEVEQALLRSGVKFGPEDAQNIANIKALLGRGTPFYAKAFADMSGPYYEYTPYKDDPKSVYEFLKNRKAPNNREGFLELAKEYLEYIGYAPAPSDHTETSTAELRGRLLDKLARDRAVQPVLEPDSIRDYKHTAEMIRNAPRDFLLEAESADTLYDPETYKQYSDDLYRKNTVYDSTGRALTRQQAEFFNDKAGARNSYGKLIPLTLSTEASPLAAGISFGDLQVYVPAKGSDEVAGYAAMQSPLVVGGPNASMVPPGMQRGRNAVLDVLLKQHPEMQKNLYATLENTGNNVRISHLASQLMGGNYKAADVIDNVAKAFGGQTPAEQSAFKKMMLMELGYDGVQIWNTKNRAYDTVMLLNKDQFFDVRDTDPNAPNDFLDDVELQELLSSVSEISGAEVNDSPEEVPAPKSDKWVPNKTTQSTIESRALSPSTLKLLKDLSELGEVGTHEVFSDPSVIEAAENWIEIHHGLDQAFEDFVVLFNNDELISLKEKNAAESTAIAWMLAVRLSQAAQENPENAETYNKAAVFANEVFEQLSTMFGQGLRMVNKVRNLSTKISLSTHKGVLGNMQRWLKGINNAYHTNIKMTEEQQKALTEWEDDDQKLKAIRDFGASVAAQLPKGFKNRKYFESLRKAMMLSAPRTGIVNFLGNVTQRQMAAVKNMIAGAISDAAFAKKDEKGYRSLKNSTKATADPEIKEDWENMNEWADTIYDAHRDAIVNTGGKWWDKSGALSEVEQAFEAENDPYYAHIPKAIGKFVLSDESKSVVKNTSKHQSDWFELTDELGLPGFLSGALPDKLVGIDLTEAKEKVRESKLPNLAGLKASWLPSFKSYLRSQGFTTAELAKANELYAAKKALKAEHDPAKVPAAEARVKECERAANAIAEAVDFATKNAQRDTYREQNAAAQMLNRIKKAETDSDNPLQKAVVWALSKAVDSEIPFTTVAFNMLDTAIRYNPVAAAAITGYQAYKRSKDPKSYSVNDIIDSAASGIAGFGIELLGYLLGMAGRLRGTGDSDEDKAEEFYTNTGGNADYAWIDEEGNSYTLDWMGPTAMRLFAGVSLYEANAKAASARDADVSLTPGEWLASLVSILGSGMGPVAEMSFMTSINNLIKSAMYADTPGDAAIALMKHPAVNYVQQAIPAISGRVANIVDPTVRSTYTPTGPYKQLEQTGRTMANKIPFLKGLVNNPKYDYFGNEMTNAVFGEDNALQQIGNALYTLYSPGYYKRNNVPEGVGDMLDEVFDYAGDASIFPDAAPKNFTVNGKKYVMSNKEFSEMSQRAGQYTASAYEMADKSYAFNNYLDGNMKAAVLSELKALGKTMAKSDYCYLNGIEGYSGDETLQKITEAQNVGIDVVTYYAAKQLIKGISGKGAAEKKRKILRQYGFDSRQIEALT